MTPHERERRRDTHDWWCAENRDMLAGCHPLVADRYIRLAWERAMQTGEIRLTPEDFVVAENQLVSGLRVHRFGVLNPDTAYEQHVTIRDELGLGPPRKIKMHRVKQEEDMR